MVLPSIWMLMGWRTIGSLLVTPGVAPANANAGGAGLSNCRPKPPLPNAPGLRLPCPGCEGLTVPLLLLLPLLLLPPLLLPPPWPGMDCFHFSTISFR